MTNVFNQLINVYKINKNIKQKYNNLKEFKMEIDIIKTPIKTRINLCYKILKTKGYSKNYTIKELIEDEN